MSSAYTPTAEYAGTDATVLADGDAASATNLNTAPKKALDRAAYLRAATDGLLVWNRSARVATGGSASGNTGVYVPPIEAVSVYDGTAWQAFSLGSETQLTTGTHFGGGTLAADTTYYVYAYVSGGSLALQVSADVPGAGLIWKGTGANTHRYLFCFHTDSTGVALPMQMRGGRYTYRLSAITSTELRALNTSTAVSATDVILARAGTAGRELIPPHARLAVIRSQLVVSGNHADDACVVTYVTKGDSTGAHRQRVNAAGSSYESNMDLEIETDSAATLKYTATLVNSDASDPTFALSTFVLGFSE